MARAAAAAELAEADDLVAQVRALQARALAIVDAADAAGDQRTALAGLREARGALQLVAQLTGALREHVEVHEPEESPVYIAQWGTSPRLPCPTCSATASPAAITEACSPAPNVATDHGNSAG